MSHTQDHAWAPVIALLADTQAKILPDGLLEGLKTFQGEHTSEAQVYYPPYDLEVRNVTTWLSEDLTIGAQSFNQRSAGGPTGTAFTPAGVQWKTGDEIGFIVVSDNFLIQDDPSDRSTLTRNVCSSEPQRQLSRQRSPPGSSAFPTPAAVPSPNSLLLSQLSLTRT